MVKECKPSVIGWMFADVLYPIVRVPGCLLNLLSSKEKIPNVMPADTLCRQTRRSHIVVGQFGYNTMYLVRVNTASWKRTKQSSFRSPFAMSKLLPLLRILGPVIPYLGGVANSVWLLVVTNDLQNGIFNGLDKKSHTPGNCGEKVNELWRERIRRLEVSNLDKSFLSRRNMYPGQPSWINESSDQITFTNQLPKAKLVYVVNLSFNPVKQVKSCSGTQM
jgi:hypothetical protein